MQTIAAIQECVHFWSINQSLLQIDRTNYCKFWLFSSSNSAFFNFAVIRDDIDEKSARIIENECKDKNEIG